MAHDGDHMSVETRHDADEGYDVLGLGGCDNLLEYKAELGDVFVGRALSKASHEGRFELSPDFINLSRLLAAHARYGRATPRLDLNQALCLQTPQDLANRGAADAHSFAEF